MRRALVTGAARRLGRAIATGLAADDWHVAVHYNASGAAAAATVDAITKAGGYAVAAAADLADPAAAGQLIAAAAKAVGGPLQCLINNASVFAFDDAATFSVADWDRHHAVNLRAPAVLARDLAAALPPGESGVVVNLLDQKVFNLNPDFFSYTLSKIGLQGLTTMLAKALAPRVRVCGVAPGLTLPPRDMDPAAFAAAQAKSPLGRGSNVDDILGAVRFILATPTITGDTIIVDGGQHLQPRAHDVMFGDGNDA